MQRPCEPHRVGTPRASLALAMQPLMCMQAHAAGSNPCAGGTCAHQPAHPTPTDASRRTTRRSWNFSLAPGWTEAEVRALKLCVMRHGVGAWSAIAATGLLPGKTAQQLSSQTQRLLGQQSLAGAQSLGAALCGSEGRMCQREGPWAPCCGRSAECQHRATHTRLRAHVQPLPHSR